MWTCFSAKVSDSFLLLCKYASWAPSLWDIMPLLILFIQPNPYHQSTTREIKQLDILFTSTGKVPLCSYKETPGILEKNIDKIFIRFWIWHIKCKRSLFIITKKLSCSFLNCQVLNFLKYVTAKCRHLLVMWDAIWNANGFQFMFIHKLIAVSSSSDHMVAIYLELWKP